METAASVGNFSPWCVSRGRSGHARLPDLDTFAAMRWRRPMRD